MSDEEWRPIPGYEGVYEVSDLGRVRHLNYRGRGVQIMRQQINHGGYSRIGLWRGPIRQEFRTHRLVAMAFLRPPEDGEVCRHLNGDQSDNRVSNLAWGSQADNVADMLRMRRHHNANKTHCSQGHPLDGVRRRGGTDLFLRYCLTCSRERNSAQRAKQRRSA